MKKWVVQLLIDLFFWSCLYAMFYNTSYKGSAETVVYMFVGWHVFMASILYAFRNHYDVVFKDFKDKALLLKKRPLLDVVYGKTTTLAEIVVLVYSGYFVCGFLYLIAGITIITSMKLVKETLGNEATTT